MKFSEVAGEAEVHPEQAVRFLREWYNEDDLVTIIGVREKQPRQPHLMANVYPSHELWSMTRESLRGLVMGDEGSLWNLYVQVCPAAHDLESPFKRGGDDNVKTFRGVWVDLDVKPGSFVDEEAALNFLRGLAVLPTIVVTTGSGGVHGYWKLDHDLTPEEGRVFAADWWSYLAEEADKVGAKVDKLVDISRMMRLPGSIRWPKKGEIRPAAPVVLKYAPPGLTVSAEQMSSISRGAAQRRYNRVLRTQTEDRQRRIDADAIAQTLIESGTNRWRLLQAIAAVEDLFAHEVTWDEILEPAGWTFLREDTHERREWARPGREEKSATTDWPESPDIMSLLSSSEETGLFDLKEAGIALTKYRVALRLWFNDNEQDMIDWTIKRITH